MPAERWPRSRPEQPLSAPNDLFYATAPGSLHVADFVEPWFSFQIVKVMPSSSRETKSLP
jgi:hypothetical protein